MSFSPDEEQVVYLDFHWGGYIVQDIIEVEDTSQPYVLNIQATDGISKLSDSIVTTSAFRIFTNQFINGLDAANVLGMYGSEHPVLAVVCNWWADEMTYNANNNPLDETWADFRAFDTIDEDGVLTGKTWMEVLEQMCYIFGLRFTIRAANTDWNNCSRAKHRRCLNTATKRTKQKLIPNRYRTTRPSIKRQTKRDWLAICTTFYPPSTTFRLL